MKFLEFLVAAARQRKYGTKVHAKAIHQLLPLARLGKNINFFEGIGNDKGIESLRLLTNARMTLNTCLTSVFKTV
ncbi:hypothetical protein DZB84_09180 [Bacillus sp. HNG]|nr:hypothetical protein DZB84_09180 [Bacillus sp. HNG]